MCIGVTLDPRAAVIGFYGVKPGHQGRGIGIRVWREVMRFLGPDRNVGLYSSPAEVEMYQSRAGFQLKDSVQMILYESSGSTTINGIAPTGDDSLDIQVLPPTATPELMDQVIAFDASVVGVDRASLIRASLREPQTISFVAVDQRNRQVLGYGTMRTTNYTDGRTILAPLYASSFTVAKVLLYNLTINCPDSMDHGFFSFVLSSNQEAQRLVEAAGLKANFGAPRLFTKSLVSGADEARVFSLLSPDVALY